MTIKRGNPVGINELLQARRWAWARGDKTEALRLDAEIQECWRNRKRSKPRTAGQRSYVSMLKRNGWL